MTELRHYSTLIAGTADVLVAERPEWTSKGLMARMTLWGTERHAEGHMVDRCWYLGTVNLTSVQERLTFQRLIAGMMAHAWRDAEGESLQSIYEPQLAWELAAFFADILQKEAETASPVVLGTDATVVRESTPLHEIGPCSLLAAHPTVYFGEGESGKSYVWAYLAGHLALRGEQVLVLDYELDEADHTDRLRRMFGEVPPLHYLKCTSPLPEMVGFLRSYAETHGITYVVVDSIAPACGTEAEASETANRYFAAIRDIGVAGSLHIAHRSKASYDKKGEEKIFGSVFWSNLARETYLITADERTPVSRTLNISCRKANLRAYPPDVKVVITFEDGPDAMVDVQMDALVVNATDERKANLLRVVGALVHQKAPLPFETWRKVVGLPQTPKDVFMSAMQEALATKLVEKIGAGWRATASGLQLVQA